MKILLKGKYINPYTDFGFKQLFARELSKELLIDFLNELIVDRGKITDLKYLKTEQQGKTSKDRKIVFDVFCENQDGEKFIVEMQVASQEYFKDRSLYYTTFPIQEQGEQGCWDYSLQAIYFIGILDFVFDETKEDKLHYHHKVKLMDVDKLTVFYDKLTFIFLEMPKFNKREEDLITHFDRWLYLLKNLGKMKKRPAGFQELVFDHLFKIAEVSQLTPEEMTKYELELKIMRDNYAARKFELKKRRIALEEAKSKAKATGWAKGMREGKQEGKKVGREEGIKEGIKESTSQIALKMLHGGISIHEISKFTGLTETEISKLNKKST